MSADDLALGRPAMISTRAIEDSKYYDVEALVWGFNLGSRLPIREAVDGGYLVGRVLAGRVLFTGAEVRRWIESRPTAHADDVCDERGNRPSGKEES